MKPTYAQTSHSERKGKLREESLKISLRLGRANAKEGKDRICH